MDLRLAPAALAAWAVAAWLVGGGPGAALVVALAAVGVAGAVGHRSRPLALLACCAAAVAASCAWQLQDVRSSPLHALAQERRAVVLDVRVARDARVFTGPAGEGSVVQVVVDRVDHRGEAWTVSDRATLFLDGRRPDLVVGRRLRVAARLAPSTSTREAAVGDVTRAGRVRGAPWWWDGAEAVRGGVRDAVDHTAPGPSALVPALVTGDDAALAAGTEEEMRRAGLTHLLAVSGTNLTIVLAVVLATARALRAPPRALLVLGLLSVAGFVLLARPEPSVLRAAAMGVVGLAAVGLGSRGGVRALAVAVVVLLVADPWLARSPGMVLSASATAGILLAAGPLADRLARWLPRWAAVAVAVPLAAQAACTPAVVAVSGEVSLVAVVANLLAAPAVAPATVLGLAAGLAHLALPAAGTVLGSAASVPAGWILFVGHHAAAQAGAVVAWRASWWLLLPVVALVCLVLWGAAARPAVVVGLVLGLLVAVWRPPQPGWPPPGWVAVACDVGQGDATVLRTGPGEAVVVDAGPDPGPVDRCLRALRVRHVRALVVSHGDLDHVGGWPGVVAGRRLDVVLEGRPGADGPPRVPRRTVAAGDRVVVGGVVLDVLWPRPDPSGREPSSDERNGLSVVLRVRSAGAVLLLAGDLGAAEQDRVLAGGSDVRAHVLKTAHHGSADQSRRFVEAVGARVATLSAGADNTYGHPAPRTLALLRDAGATPWRTDLAGDVALVVRDGRLSVVARGSGQRSR